MAKTKSRKTKPDGYVHGYTEIEQNRLRQQARFLEHHVYEMLDFSMCKRIIEVGSGVGAQTEILLRRFPHLAIECVDVSPAQIEQARRNLKPFIDQGRVKIHQSDVRSLPFADNSFDGAFLCWLLEHIPRPVEALTEVRRVLRSGGRIFCNETLNSTFFLDPYSPATLQFLFALNDQQWEMGGDPFLGAKLGNLLTDAGFQSITTWVRSLHFDKRAPKMRAQMIEYWADLLLSAGPELLKAGKVTKDLIEQMSEELEIIQKDPNSVFFDAWIQAQGMVF